MMKQQKKKKKSSKKKVIRKYGNTPVYMRNEVTPYMLREYPQYKHLFKRCSVCNKLSLKPVGINLIKDVSKVVDIKDWKCNICGYTLVRQ